MPFDWHAGVVGGVFSTPAFQKSIKFVAKFLRLRSSLQESFSEASLNVSWSWHLRIQLDKDFVLSRHIGFDAQC